MGTGAFAGRARRTSAWAILVLVLGLVLWGAPALGHATPAPATLPPTGAHAVAPTPSHTAVRSGSHPDAAAHPGLVTNVTLGTVYNSTLIAPPAPANIPCYWQNYSPYDYHYCYSETQTPSILSLSNGQLGLGYSVYTVQGPQCNNSTSTNLTSWTSTNIAWAHSATNGTSWSAAQIIGNGTCRWPSSAEPSFATGSGSSVYGAFILSNDTVNASYLGGSQPIFPPDWSNATGDAIGFVSSADNGTTWTNTTEVPGVTGAARPSVAVFGNTIYVAYIFIPNSSATYPIGNYYGNTPAPAVQLVYSSNGGSTWLGPYTLPGMNASMGNWSTSPSVAVNSAGTVAVAYATNRTCVGQCSYPIGSNFADQVVVATSSSNGSTWSTPSAVGGFSGEVPYSQDYYDNYYPANDYPWQTNPDTSIAYASSSTLYVAYSGGYLVSASLPYYYNYQYSGVFASMSTNGGVAWTASTVNAPLGGNNYDSEYSPAIGISPGGTPYIAYVWLNNSYCSNYPCSPLVGGYSSWVATSSNGVNWTSTYSGISAMPGPYYSDSGWSGWTSSVAFTAAGSVVTATSLLGGQSFQFVSSNSTNIVYAATNYANVSIGFPYVGPTTNMLFLAINLSSGSTWGVSVDGYPGLTNVSSINFTGVPIGLGVSVAVVPQPSGYRTIESATLDIQPWVVVSGPTNVDVNFSTEYGVSFALEPVIVPDAEIYFNVGTSYYDIFSNNGYTSPSQPLPWYFPGNTTLHIMTFGEPPITYWNGTGPGSYTGGGQEVNLTVTGPFNETAWAGSFGVYTEQFTASGLPSSSVYSFHFNGQNYSAPSTSPTNVSGVVTGGYSVSGITANSSTAGWEYFGWIPGGSNVIVVPAEPTVAFQFAYVDVATPVGQVTFHATGIGTGTIWSVQFNGTYYSASTPWLNVSTHSGTFPWAVGAAVAANASVGYAPVGTGGSVSVTTGSTVNIAYTSAYRVDVIAGLGGSVSGAGNHWLANGALTTYTAAPSNGYSFGGWTGTGAGSYTGANLTASVTVNGAVTETASFYPLPSARFNVTFQQTTIPTGTWWTVYLDGVGYSSNTGMLTVSNLLSCAAGVSGQYNETVPFAYDNTSGTTRYVAVNPTRSFCTYGGLLQPLTFVPEYQVTVSATPGGTAYVADSITSVVSNESLWAQPTDNVIFTAVHSPGYSFGGWNGTGAGSYTGSNVNPPVSVGGAVTEFATFVPIPPVPHPTYTETFVSSVAFAVGTSWSVKIGSTSYAGVGPKIVVAGLAPAVYSVTLSIATSADGRTRWSPASSAAFPLHVTATADQTVTYGKPSFWVTIGGSAGGSEIPASGWYVTGASLVLNATPNLGQTFVSWQGTGDGNYTGNQSGTTLVVLGEITEFASFQPAAKAATVITSFWSSPTTWAILGLVGLLVGLIVGIAVRRFRTAPASTKAPAPMAPWTADDSGTGSGGGGTAAGGTP